MRSRGRFGPLLIEYTFRFSGDRDASIRFGKMPDSFDVMNILEIALGFRIGSIRNQHFQEKGTGLT